MKGGERQCRRAPKASYAGGCLAQKAAKKCSKRLTSSHSRALMAQKAAAAVAVVPTGISSDVNRKKARSFVLGEPHLIFGN